MDLPIITKLYMSLPLKECLFTLKDQFAEVFAYFGGITKVNN
jgi:hypothetical protein